MSELQFSWLRRGPTGAASVLRLEKVTIKVGIRDVLENIDLEIEDGAVMSLSGPNGSGKSTLLNAVAGLAPALVISGRIFFLDRDVTAMAAYERAQLGLSLMRQRENVFPDLTVEENLRLALGRNGSQRLREVFPAWSAMLPLSKRAGLLSGGQRQRLGWAMAVLRPFRLLLADEPEAGFSEQLALPESGSCIVASHGTGHFTTTLPCEEN